MIDLKSKIENNITLDKKLLQKYNVEVGNELMKANLEGKILAHENLLQSLDDFNITVTPKSVKLSEIINKLKSQLQDTLEDEIYFNREIKAIGYGEYDIDWQQNSWYTLVKFNKDLTISNINMRIQKNVKWLYCLWSSETEIIDDLECDE